MTRFGWVTFALLSGADILVCSDLSVSDITFCLPSITSSADKNVCTTPIAESTEPKYTAKYEKHDSPAGLAKALSDLLSQEALVVRGDNGDPIMKLWFRSEIPVQATEEQVRNGLTYREIPETTLIGALELPRAFVDFRKQEIPSGLYTLRFVIQPETGDHTGTAPHTEFCLMSPAAKDKSAERMEVKSLIEKSSEINEGKHPAVLLLFPHSGKEDGPKVIDKGNGVWIAVVRRAVVAGERKSSLGFGITLAGTTK